MSCVIRLGALVALASVSAALPAAAQGAKARFTLTGGPQAGSYEMTVGPVCESFEAGSEDHGFGADFVADAPPGWHRRTSPPYLSHMWFSTPRIRSPRPDEFWLAVVFTKGTTPETEIKYEVFTIPAERDPHPEHAKQITGHGEAKVQRSAGGFSATFRGETADGVRIEGSLQCE
ncbi:MAG TPA: hypothetical protein VFW66_08040 [Gemmatimonadales bacterium]|nr:hypothetical protein [Gemmatimonadales bacterium]